MYTLSHITFCTGIPRQQNKRWSLKETQYIAPFSPISYRPSIQRRIRDTWYLYAAVGTCITMFFLSLLPTYFLLSTDGYCGSEESFVQSNRTVNSTSFSRESGIFEAGMTKHGKSAIRNTVMQEDDMSR